MSDLTAKRLRQLLDYDPGLFPTIEQAKTARDNAARQLHGEFFHE